MYTPVEIAAEIKHYYAIKVQDCIVKLTHGGCTERLNIINQLCTIGFPSVHPLIEQLYDENNEVVFYAKLALTRLGTHATSALIDVLKNDERSQVRCGAAHVLGRIGNIQATKPLSQCLNASDVGVRQAAAYALMILIDSNSIASLCQALKDNDWIVRCCAAVGLGNIRSGYAKTDLSALYQDPNRYVREYAREALEKIEIASQKRLMLYKLRCLQSRANHRTQRLRGKLVQKDQKNKSANLSVPDEQNFAAYSKAYNRPNSWAKQHEAIPFRIAVSVDNTYRGIIKEGKIKSETGAGEGADKGLQNAQRNYESSWINSIELLIEKLNERTGPLLLIVEMLGEIGDPRAIKPLFRLLSCDDEVLQATVEDALLELGVSAKVIDKYLQRNDADIGPICGRNTNSVNSKPATATSARIIKQTRTGYNIPTSPKPEPQTFVLNMNSVQQKIVETAQVQELLQTHFQEDTPVSIAPSPVVRAVVTSVLSTSAANPFHALDSPRFVLLNMLLQKPVWKLAEISALAAPLGLMASGALEQFNDMAYEISNEPIFEGDDPVEVNLALAKELLA